MVALSEQPGQCEWNICVSKPDVELKQHDYSNPPSYGRRAAASESNQKTLGRIDVIQLLRDSASCPPAKASENEMSWNEKEERASSRSSESARGRVRE